MLGKELRKKLQEHSWEYIVKNDSNPWQTWHRLRSSVNITLNDFVLLSNKLPEEKQAEIFSSKKFEKFIKELLPYNKKNIELDPRRTELAALLVEKGVNYCVTQYQLIEPDIKFNQPVIDKLRQAWFISQDLPFKVKEQISKSNPHLCSKCKRKMN